MVVTCTTSCVQAIRALLLHMQSHIAAPVRTGTELLKQLEVGARILPFLCNRRAPHCHALSYSKQAFTRAQEFYQYGHTNCTVWSQKLVLSAAKCLCAALAACILVQVVCIHTQHVKLY